MTQHITVDSMEKAWEKAAELFPTDWDYDNGSRERAGYPIYRSTAEGHYYDYICDLCARLEINLSDNTTINIWIEEPEEAPELEEKPDEEIQKMIDASANAKAAGADGFMNYTKEGLTVFSFVVNHSSYFGTDAERATAENILSAEYPSLLIYDYADAWFKAKGLHPRWMEVKGKPIKYQHGKNPEEYHVCFDVLACVPDWKSGNEAFENLCNHF